MKLDFKTKTTELLEGNPDKNSLPEKLVSGYLITMRTNVANCKSVQKLRDIHSLMTKLSNSNSFAIFVHYARHFLNNSRKLKRQMGTLENITLPNYPIAKKLIVLPKKMTSINHYQTISGQSLKYIPSA